MYRASPSQHACAPPRRCAATRTVLPRLRRRWLARSARRRGPGVSADTNDLLSFRSMHEWHAMPRQLRKDELRSRRFAKKLRTQMSHAEAILWCYLRPATLTEPRFRRQHPIGPYVADFACVKARLVVEVD